MSYHDQSIDLRPDKRHFLIPYAIGVLAIPMLGAGIWIILHYRKKWKGLCCRITNSDITLINREHQTTILLSEVSTCTVTSSRLQKRFGLGNIIIRHNDGVSTFPGIADPEPVAKLIERGARSEQERLKMREKIAQDPAPHPTRTLEKKNELVGLWQQGLINEDDYRRELKKFE